MARTDSPILRIDPAHPDRAFSRCREVIAAGGVVVYPTDTFYGLGVDPRNAAAVRRLFEIKGRQAGQPILLLIGGADDVLNWAAEIPGRAGELIRQHWPGPLTVVFRARPDVAAELTAGTGTIGLRVPGNDITRRLLVYLGTALTGTSANISGAPSPATAEEAAAGLAGRVDLILDGGAAPGAKPSTVVDASVAPVRIIREGAVKL